MRLQLLGTVPRMPAKVSTGNELAQGSGHEMRVMHVNRVEGICWSVGEEMRRPCCPGLKHRGLGRLSAFSPHLFLLWLVPKRLATQGQLQPSHVVPPSTVPSVEG